MIKLCIDARMINSSGIGTYLKNILLHLNRDIFNISLLVKPLDNLDGYKDFHLIFCSSDIYSLKEQLLFPFSVSPCDIFWSPHFNIPLLPIKAKKRVVTIHDLYHLAFFNQLSRMEKCYARTVISQAVKRSAKIITVSNFSKKELIKYFPQAETKIEVIYNGVDKKRFNERSDPKMTDKVLSKYGICSKYFLFVGNVKKHKNLSGLIKAFSLFLKNSKEDYQLAIVGNKESLRNFDDLSFLMDDEATSQKIKVITAVNDSELVSLYRGSTALVYPSFYEGFGLPPLEAMCCQTPVIASKAASMPEVCGDSVYYIDPTKPTEIAEAMILFAQDEKERNRYIQLGDRQKDKFFWEKTAKLHEAIFIKVANE